jgi:hypothetical protein
MSLTEIKATAYESANLSREPTSLINILASLCTLKEHQRVHIDIERRSLVVLDPSIAVSLYRTIMSSSRTADISAIQGILADAELWLFRQLYDFVTTAHPRLWPRMRVGDDTGRPDEAARPPIASAARRGSAAGDTSDSEGGDTDEPIRRTISGGSITRMACTTAERAATWVTARVPDVLSVPHTVARIAVLVAGACESLRVLADTTYSDRSDTASKLRETANEVEHRLSQLGFSVETLRAMASAEFPRE